MHPGLGNYMLEHASRSRELHIWAEMERDNNTFWFHNQFFYSETIITFYLHLTSVKDDRLQESCVTDVNNLVIVCVYIFLWTEQQIIPCKVFIQAYTKTCVLGEPVRFSYTRFSSSARALPAPFAPCPLKREE